MTNITVLTGNLTRDPEPGVTAAGNPVTAMRLAVPRPRKNGEDQGADFVDVSVFGPQAESCVKYLAKGRKILVEGRLRHSEWESENGRRQKLEVIARRIEFLSSAPTSVGSGNGNGRGATEPVTVGDAAAPAGDGEDIPF
jgi:single-strand DNA-binding protein